MSALPFALRLSTCLLVVGAGGCLQPRAPNTVVSASATAPSQTGAPQAASLPSTSTALPPRLQELAWTQRDRHGVTSDLPPGLHSFSLGRWECALSEVRAADVRTEQGAQLSRTRRIACTHASGATVQSQLVCALAAPTNGAPDEGARTLELTLDSTPWQLACEPRGVTRLPLRGADERSLGALCATAEGVQPCTEASAP